MPAASGNVHACSPNISAALCVEHVCDELCLVKME